MKPFIKIFWLISLGLHFACNSSERTSKGVSSIRAIFPEAQFNRLFPHRNKLYTYQGLLTASRYFPLFAAEGDLDTRKNELAAFLAIISQETFGGWAGSNGGPYEWGLFYTEEQACVDGGCAQYNTAGKSPFKPQSDQNYYGRGPMQLSYAYNYGLAGKELKLDILKHPSRVSEDPVIAFETAIWFWMRAQNGKPSCHDIMIKKWRPNPSDSALNRHQGFGMVINVVNGGVECGPDRSADGREEADGRIGFYRYYCHILKVVPSPRCDCGDMVPYAY